MELFYLAFGSFWRHDHFDCRKQQENKQYRSFILRPPSSTAMLQSMSRCSKSKTLQISMADVTGKVANKALCAERMEGVRGRTKLVKPLMCRTSEEIPGNVLILLTRKRSCLLCLVKPEEVTDLQSPWRLSTTPFAQYLGTSITSLCQNTFEPQKMEVLCLTIKWQMN